MKRTNEAANPGRSVPGGQRRRSMQGTVLYRGGSMRSCFRPLERLGVARTPWESLCAGDVVLYQHPTEPVRVVHRLVWRDGDGWRTRGDDRLRMDRDRLTEDRYLGRVVAVFRDGHWWEVTSGWAGWVRGTVVWVARAGLAVVRKGLR